MLPALLCLASCAQDVDPKSKVPEQIPEEVKEYGGDGVLLYGEDEEATGHAYVWSAKETTISINVNIDTDEATDRGDWEMGHFELPASQINEFLGVFVGSELDESTFYAVEPDGTQVEEMTSYKPGMWINDDSYSGNWASGVFYWQWYVWGGKVDKKGNVIEYDYDYNEYPSRFMVGTNPSNIPAAAGKTVTSKCVIVANQNKYDFIVNLIFS